MRDDAGQLVETERKTSTWQERDVVDRRPGQRTGDRKFQPLVDPRQLRLALDREEHLHHFALVDCFVLDGVDAADHSMDAGWPASHVVGRLVRPAAQRSFSNVVVVVDVHVAFADATTLPVMQMTMLETHTGSHFEEERCSHC